MSALPEIVEDPARPGVRMFSDAALQVALDKALVNFEPGEFHVGFVAHADIKEWVVVGAVQSSAGRADWSVGGFLKKEWKGDLEFGAEARVVI